MRSYYKNSLLLFLIVISVVVLGSVVGLECGCSSREAVIFVFGDSNSDTGGAAAGKGIIGAGYPDGRAFFGRPTGRLCDGRLLLDFLCENLETNYMSPYLESLEPNFSNGVNFAVAGASAFPKIGCFNLDTQIHQFRRFHNHSVLLQSKGYENLVGEDDFKSALYIIDIGQNDLTNAFNQFPDDKAVERIPLAISEIKDAMQAIYEEGGRNLWVHNTGPLGCLPEKLGTRHPNASQVDEHGCITIMNEAAKQFNSQLYDLCNQMRDEMNDSTIVYVDVYSIKYAIIANSSLYGFKNPLAACCGNGGLPYNYDPKRQCRGSSYTLCDVGNEGPRLSWDGIHYTEAANSIVASAILSAKYSTPPLPFNFFCN